MSKTVDLTNYDSIAEIYISKVEKELSWNNLYEREYMTSIFDDFDGKSVLDVGAGTGFYAKYALNHNATQVIAVDASQKMLDYIAANDESKSIGLYKADLKDGLPQIATNSQDYIICSLVLHYIEDWRCIFEDFHRILKPNGKLYISTHHPLNDYIYLDKPNYFKKYIIKDTWGQGDNQFDVHYYTRPLSDLMRPIIDSPFIMECMAEPLPSQRCKELATEIYEQLSAKPGFLFFTLRK